MSDQPMQDDRDVAPALAVATLDPSDEFRDRLRRELQDNATGGSAAIRVLPMGDSPRRRPVWPILGAAAAVLALVVTLAIVSDRQGDAELDPSDPETIEVDSIAENALTDDALATALAGRRWYALERFDTPNPSVLTPTFFVSGSVFSPHDGCDEVGRGGTSFDGLSIRFTDNDDDNDNGDAATCNIDPAFPFASGQQIELLAGAESFLLRDRDDVALARFTALDALEPATTEFMQFAWYVDDLGLVEFSASGRGFTDCTQLAWEEVDTRIVVTLADDGIGCGGDTAGYRFSEVTLRLRELTNSSDGSGGATVYRTANGLLLTDGAAGIELRTIEPTPIEADRATIAAGALFGVQPAVGVSPDDVIAAAEPLLGAPDHDSGWLDRRNADRGPIQTCGLNNYREIMWGDLVTTFWQSGARTVFLSWHVGDDRFELLAKPEADRPEPTGPTELSTEHGVRVGDPGELIPDRFHIARTSFGDGDDRFTSDDAVERVTAISPNPAATPGSLVPSVFSGGYLVIDGRVAAFGSELFDC